MSTKNFSSEDLCLFIKEYRKEDGYSQKYLECILKRGLYEENFM